MLDPGRAKKDESNSVPQRRMSRVFSVIAIASSCLLFACAGCCFITTIFIRATVVESPEGAAHVVAQITDWTLPPGFQGKAGTTINNVFMRIDIGRFGHETGRGTLIVGQLQSKSFHLPEQRKQTRELIDRIAPDLKRIKIERSESRTMTIRGLPAEFQVDTGEDLASTTRYRQVTGVFRGKLDETLLILQFEEGVLTDAEIDDFLKSIK